jgi:predicted O-methyltransferase YrrM
MKFEQVYRTLFDYQESLRFRMILLTEETLREIYDCVIATRAKDCLELGTGHGATTCVIAAAMEETGGGTVTTIDREPNRLHDIKELAPLTGMTRYIRAVVHPLGYNWVLNNVLRQQIKDGTCEPCLDFCYLDGAHEWVTDGLAALLAIKLLRPGGWLMMDDLNFKLRGSHPGWERDHGGKTDEELDTAQVGMVFDLLVRTHPDLERLALTNTGHIGWARKVSGRPPLWLPNGVRVGPVPAAMHQAYDGLPLGANADGREGVVLEKQERGTLVRSTITDPWVVFDNPIQPPQPIDFVTLRLRLVTPGMETMQLFWLNADDRYFHEEHSRRCMVRASDEAQDLTFEFVGGERERTIRTMRLDPGDEACDVLVESVTFGRW